jgi:hypothetical protein
MTREEAKKLLPFIQAYCEGKQIQWLKPDSDEWIDVVGGDNVDFEDLTEFDVAYRIKPESKYRSFENTEECWQEMQKHKPFGWIKDKNDGHYSMVAMVDDAVIRISGDKDWFIDEITNYYTFADGAPFGINIEEE